MSKIGRKPIIVPAGVEVKINGQQFSVKGSKGELQHTIHHGVTAKLDQEKIFLTVDPQLEHAMMLWGLERSLVANLVIGVSQGYEKKLELTGVGFRVVIQGKKLTLSLGFSHPVEMLVPEGIEAKVVKNVLILTSIQKELLGQFAAEVRGLKPPEPYKGKGIRYSDEHVRRKEGKKAAAAEGSGSS